MSTLRYFLIGAVALFGAIGAIGWLKRAPREKSPAPIVQEIVLPVPKIPRPAAKESSSVKKIGLGHEKKGGEVPTVKQQEIRNSDDLPDANRIGQLFALDSSKLPIVETVSYTSRVPWLKGRPAWIADYASHFETSRHFIARSLNKKRDYFTQKVGPGDKFNVFKKEINFRFHLLIDLSRSKLWFYYIDSDAGERVLLKTYRVGIGRLDPQKKSGYLTPLGTYELGEKIAIYKPGTMGFFQDQKTEMIRVFGTRWIPFEKEIAGCTEPVKGLGLHGAPWTADPLSGQLNEDLSKIGKYDSDGCIRLTQEDIEEIFAIVITKPTTIELVKDFRDAKLPGVEK
jgi:hypothetical protein